MIFQHTIDRVFDPAHPKTQTLRMALPGDYLAVSYPGCADEYREVISHDCRRCDRVRWRTGKTYAVQRGRGKPSEGRILCTSLREVLDPREAVDQAFARSEGFGFREEFLAAWARLHRDPWRRCWAIGFRLEDGK